MAFSTGRGIWMSRRFSSVLPHSQICPSCVRKVRLLGGAYCKANNLWHSFAAFVCGVHVQHLFEGAERYAGFFLVQDPFLRGLLSMLLFCIYHRPRSVFDPKHFLRRRVPVPIHHIRQPAQKRKLPPLQLLPASAVRRFLTEAEMFLPSSFMVTQSK